MDFKVFLGMFWGVGLCFLAYGVKCEKVFVKDVQGLAKAMTERLQLGRGQEDLFNIYKQHAFSFYRGSPSLSKVLDTLEKNPGLYEKPVVRDQVIQFSVREGVKKPDHLVRFIKSFRDSAGRVRGRLLNISANMGFWRNLLGMPKVASHSEVLDGQKPGQGHRNNEDFWEKFHQFMDSEELAFVEGKTSGEYKSRVGVVFQSLDKMRRALEQQGLKGNRNILLAMVNLVGTVGFGNPVYREMLRSLDAGKNREGIHKILSDREDMSLKLGFDSFAHLKRSLLPRSGDHGQLVPAAQDLSLRLEELERDLQKNPGAGVLKERGSRRMTVRALSVQESPFRGCMGGDCSTDRYFLKALDHDFLYFTVTDSHYKSSGVVAVVLGQARRAPPRGERVKALEQVVKVAFVDKVQNIPPLMLKPVLTAVKLSLEPEGYLLALPLDMGSGVGISNSEMIRNELEGEVLSHSSLQYRLVDFSPHHKERDSLFYRGYTRAYHNLELREVGDFPLNTVQILPGELHSPKVLDEGVKVSQFYRQLKAFGDSAEEGHQLQFLHILSGEHYMEYFGLSQEDVMQELKLRVVDKNLSYRVRKTALFQLMNLYPHKPTFPLKVLNDVWPFFSKEEQKLLIGEMSNWDNSIKTGILIRNILDGFFVQDQKFDFLMTPEWVKLLISVKGGNQAMKDAIRYDNPHLVKALVAQGVKPPRFSNMDNERVLIVVDRGYSILPGDKAKDLQKAIQDSSGNIKP